MNGVGRGVHRILGIDPGSRRAGYGVIERPRAAGFPGRRAGWRAARAGVVEVRGAPPERLAALARAFRAIVAETRPDVAALEEAFYGKDPRGLIRMGEARGAILAALVEAGVPVRQFPPATVKRAVTGFGNAGKERVAAMVARLLVGAAGAAGDAADALAVALCCAHRVEGFGAGGAATAAGRKTCRART